MAVYHFSAKIISRANGSSALASAAYRSASRLHDERLDRNHDFSNKAGVVHSEVLLPEGAPEHLADREKLWNAVEAAELRKDAQLSREVEFAIPRELDKVESIGLAREFVEREFVEREFVDRGMIADLNVHWDVGADGEPKPHAHVMLTLRDVDESGFTTFAHNSKSTAPSTYLSAGYAILGRRADAEAALARDPEFAQAKNTFDCLWNEATPDNGECRRRSNQVDLNLVLTDWYLHRPGEDPYPISEILFSGSVNTWNNAGPITEIICRIFEGEAGSPCESLRAETRDHGRHHRRARSVDATAPSLWSADSRGGSLSSDHHPGAEIDPGPRMAQSTSARGS